jgi:hypothetical protein
MVIELLGGEVAELILHPDCPSLGAKHDQVEANAFARVAVAASPGFCPDRVLKPRRRR